MTNFICQKWNVILCHNCATRWRIDSKQIQTDMLTTNTKTRTRMSCTLLYEIYVWLLRNRYKAVSTWVHFYTGYPETTTIVCSIYYNEKSGNFEPRLQLNSSEDYFNNGKQCSLFLVQKLVLTPDRLNVYIRNKSKCTQ